MLCEKIVIDRDVCDNPSEVCLKLYDEDWTLGMLLRNVLSTDWRVNFVGCRKQHPTHNHIELRIGLSEAGVEFDGGRGIVWNELLLDGLRALSRTFQMLNKDVVGVRKLDGL